jgi:hypothetical protein
MERREKNAAAELRRDHRSSRYYLVGKTICRCARGFNA